MRGILTTVTTLAALAGAGAVPAGAADELAPAGTFGIRCDDTEIRLAAGPGATIVRDRDGRVTIFGRDGARAAASCSSGCLEALGTASCAIVAPGPGVTPSFTVSCPEGDTFVIDRHGPDGNCDVHVDAGNRVTGATCDDGEGNRASVDCSINDGEGHCTDEAGATTCNRAPSGA